jgi:indolepyruvate ferredoxin oxidoreductase beta subunit
MILGVEPMESLRYLPYLAKQGWLITNTRAFKNIPNYPDEAGVMQAVEALQQHVALDADSIAKDLGSGRAANMVMLGAASPFLELSFDALQDGIRAIFDRKGDKIVAMNINALEAGRKISQDKCVKRDA